MINETVRGSLEFTDLPLIGVSARIVFSADTIQLFLPRIVKLAQVVADRFPTVETPTSFEMPPGRRVLKPVPGFIPIASFVAHRPDVRVAVQNDLLRWTWTRGAGPKPAEYPRYGCLRKDLLWFAEVLSEEMGEGRSKIESISMEYANFIPTSEHSTKETLSHYLSPIVQSEATRDSSFLHEITLNWRTDDGLDRKFQFKPAERVQGEEKVDGYLLITTVGGFLKEGQSSSELLDAIHTDLQGFFLLLITDQAKKEWGYVECR